ncbi:ATP-binding protein [Acrocarpospora catenulata]|uniref:ATP-binding protein n=1 Tax=Acrocarpospora catenulata TaxID=2836182 RepID=UPI001BDB3A98|nr:AAA family ATPase [Acrocarpospora catenulata]
MTVEIRMLGRFEVLVDGVPGPPEPWRRRHAAALVKVLALTRRRSMHREQLIDLLWPDLTVEEAAPRLHKAAHYARHGLRGAAEAVVLRGDTVALRPGLPVTIDVEEFEAAALAAVEQRAPAADALARYGGTLLPEDRYEPWAEAARDRISTLHQQLLRLAGRWEELLAADPADEEAHLALMRGYLRDGDRTSVLRQFERMDRALRGELGISPGAEAVALRDQALAALPAATLPRPPAATASGLVGRDDTLRTLRRALDEAAAGSSRTVLLSGPPGVGKTALLDWVRAEVTARGWRTGAGAAATIEGAWPYAPVLEALADLCRAHPALLDGLDDRYSRELDRALSLREPADDEEGGHQRLFVAAGALLGVAAAGSGVALLVDDVHEADDASLRLLHYLARVTRHDPVILVVTHRDDDGHGQLTEFHTSLGRRDSTVRVPVTPLDQATTRTLVQTIVPGLPPDAVEEIWQLSAGLPFAATELARAMADVSAAVPLSGGGRLLTDRLPVATRDLLSRVALVGLAFDTDEFVALSGLPDPLAYAQLQSALSARIIERTGTGFRFRHALLREELVAGLPAERRAALHHDAARRLGGLGASPARIAHHLVAAGAVREAVPHLLAAAKAEATVGAYRDALVLLDTARGHATGKARAEMAVLRGELLGSLGDPAVVEAYREAVRVGSGELRRRALAGLSRAATLSGDLATGADALAGLDLNGGPNDVAILLARGNLAYFQGDLDAAWQVTEQARELIAAHEDWRLLDLITLQGLVAHSRGEWFERLSLELRYGRQSPRVAAAVFDSHLCVAEYLLYGPTPYPQVIELARSLRATAERAGVLRAVAFASTLLGEAALLSGDVALAETELTEAAELYRDIGARAGEAHCLQRLAEVRLAGGQRAEARELCERALPLARWSAIALHLLQRVFGTLITAADRPEDARDTVFRAEHVLGAGTSCPFCAVMLAVPATIACADAGDLEAARRHLAVAEHSAQLWDGTAWQAAICEARAHLALAEGDRDGAHRLAGQAERIFTAIGQPLDARRCRLLQEGLTSATASATSP